MKEKRYFKVASGRMLREKYGLSADNRPAIRLNPSRVPEQFRMWIPLAQRWGISDDLIREDSVQNATREELRNLLTFGEVYDTVLGEWLAGPESQSSKPTKEYVAFTCLGMAWDLAQGLAQKQKEQ